MIGTRVLEMRVRDMYDPAVRVVCALWLYVDEAASTTTRIVDLSNLTHDGRYPGHKEMNSKGFKGYILFYNCLSPVSQHSEVWQSLPTLNLRETSYLIFMKEV